MGVGRLVYFFFQQVLPGNMAVNHVSFCLIVAVVCLSVGHVASHGLENVGQVELRGWSSLSSAKAGFIKVKGTVVVDSAMARVNSDSFLTRGTAVVVLDDNLNVLKKGTFDLYGVQSSAAQLNTFLATIPDRAYFAGITGDTSNQFASQVKANFDRLGITKHGDLGYRHGLAFYGRKGDPCDTVQAESARGIVNLKFTLRKSSFISQD